MLICSLQKPESTLDQIRKGYTKLKPTDVALLSIAVVLCGRYALAHYEEEQYDWPKDYDRLTKALLRELEIAKQSTEEPTKKTAKAAAETPVPEIKIHLIPNYVAGERFLGDREDLKKILSELLTEGIEYTTTPNDIGWQWALDRADWSVLSNGECTQKVHFATEFPPVEVKKKTKTASKKAAE